jgi:DUF4097 and DUF4098 domain-containing protein YvlB
MSKPKVVLFLAAANALALAQNPEPKLACEDHGLRMHRLSTHCEMKEQTLPASKSVLVVNPGANGGITVKGWDRSDVLVRARIEAAAPSDSEARDLASQIRVASGAGNIEAQGPSTDHDHSWTVTYEIFAPRNSDLDAKAYNGGIHMEDLRGKIRFDSTNGGITLRRLAGDVEGRTTNGGVTIELSGDRWDGGGLDVETTNGAVKLGVPAAYSAHIETMTTNGGIKTDMPVTVQGHFSNHDLSFNVGSGGATIRAVTTNGGVKIYSL